MCGTESIHVVNMRPGSRAGGGVASRSPGRRHHVHTLSPARARQPPADDRSSVPLPGARRRFRASMDLRTWRPRRPARPCAWIDAGWNRRPEATFMRFECEQQAGPVITGDSLPGHTRERTFKRPQQIQTDVRVRASGTKVRSYRTRPTQLRQRSDAGPGEHLLRPGPKAGKLGKWNAARHEVVGAGRPSSVRRVFVICLPQYVRLSTRIEVDLSGALGFKRPRQRGPQRLRSMPSPKRPKTPRALQTPPRANHLRVPPVDPALQERRVNCRRDPT